MSRHGRKFDSQTIARTSDPPSVRSLLCDGRRGGNFQRPPPVVFVSKNDRLYSDQVAQQRTAIPVYRFATPPSQPQVARRWVLDDWVTTVCADFLDCFGRNGFQCHRSAKTCPTAEARWQRRNTFAAHQLFTLETVLKVVWIIQICDQMSFERSVTPIPMLSYGRTDVWEVWQTGDGRNRFERFDIVNLMYVYHNYLFLINSVFYLFFYFRYELHQNRFSDRCFVRSPTSHVSFMSSR